MRERDAMGGEQVGEVRPPGQARAFERQQPSGFRAPAAALRNSPWTAGAAPASDLLHIVQYGGGGDSGPAPGPWKIRRPCGSTEQDRVLDAIDPGEQDALSGTKAGPAKASMPLGPVGETTGLIAPPSSRGVRGLGRPMVESRGFRSRRGRPAPGEVLEQEGEFLGGVDPWTSWLGSGSA